VKTYFDPFQFVIHVANESRAEPVDSL